VFSLMVPGWQIVPWDTKITIQAIPPVSDMIIIARADNLHLAVSKEVASYHCWTCSSSYLMPS
jgi:hypothetical protein